MPAGAWAKPALQRRGPVIVTVGSCRLAFCSCAPRIPAQSTFQSFVTLEAALRGLRIVPFMEQSSSYTAAMNIMAVRTSLRSP
jgi:hypothetical protein